MWRTTFRAASSSMTFGGLMPDTAKILPFRGRPTTASCSREEALVRARAYLATRDVTRSAELVSESLGDADVLTAICAEMWDLINTSPADVGRESPLVYKWLMAKAPEDFFFDERDYFLGEVALLAGGSCRLLGRRGEAETWFDRSDANFRNTVSPAAHLARVAYNRLALRYDMNRHDEVLELLPSAAVTFRRLGMQGDLAKCYFLEAMSLKVLGRLDQAASRLEALTSTDSIDAALRGLALINLGNLYSSQGALDRALGAYNQARPLLEASRRLSTLADLKVMFGETLRAMGRVAESLDTYREAIADHVSLGMVTRAAYLRVALAEALLEAEKPREAEWELLAALPTIHEQKMVPEGFAAIALLQESVRQRKTDPQSLLELRQYLQAQN